jgi:hypothetical protein
MAHRIDELEDDLERAYLLLRHVGAPPTGGEVERYRGAAVERRFAPGRPF